MNLVKLIFKQLNLGFIEFLVIFVLFLHNFFYLDRGSYLTLKYNNLINMINFQWTQGYFFKIKKINEIVAGLHFLFFITTSKRHLFAI